MKNNFLLLYLFAALLTFSSCSKTKYTHAIPADAATVISIDMKSIAEKSGINDKENTALKQHLTDALKNGLANETSERLTKILDKPSKSGFDLTEPVYVYSAKEFDNKVVVDLCVDDRSDVNATVDDLSKSQICTPSEDAGDYKFSIVMGKAILAYNRGTALLVEAESGMTDKVRSALDKVMKQKEEESFASNKAFDALKDRKGDVRFYLSTTESLSAVSLFGQKEASKGGMDFIGDLNFDNGLISMQIEQWGGNKQNKVSGFKPINNAVLAYFPQHLPIMFTVGIDGQSTYKQLVASGLIEEDTIDEIPFLQKLLNAIHGDLTIGYNSFGKGEPAFLAYAQITDVAAITNICNEVKQMPDGNLFAIKKESANDYSFAFGKDKKSIYYGVKADRLYVTNDASLVNYKVSGSTYVQNPYARQAKGKTMFFVFDTSELVAQTALQKKLGPLVSTALIQKVNCIRGFNTGANAWSIEMMWKDKQTNALKQIVQLARQITGM